MFRSAIRFHFALAGVLFLAVPAGALPQTPAPRESSPEPDVVSVAPALLKRDPGITVPVPKSRPHFRDFSAQAGLTTVPHTRVDRRFVLDTMAGGGVALFDCDNDGKLDLIGTRFGNQPASLYWSRGDHFTDIAAQGKPASLTTAPVKWGTGFGDFDNDGWPDIIIANGNFTTLMDTIPGEARFAEPLQLFRNLGDRTFEEIADSAGLNDAPLRSRRGTAFGDINNDGNLDLAVFNVAGPPSVFLNETTNGNHRVLFRLIGTKSNAMAIGARVRVITPKMRQIDEVHGGGSYNSSDDTRLHFGLGTDSVMDKVEVSWPSGVHQEFTNVAADAIYEIKEGQAIRKIASLPAP